MRPSSYLQVRASPLQVLYVLALGSFLAALVVVDVVNLLHSTFAWDFRAFYEGGHRYLDGKSPYVSRSLADLTGQRTFVYPPPAAALFAPVTLLPYHLAAGLFVCVSGVMLVAALYLLGLRDIRCYAAVLIGAPALEGLDLGTVSPILVFLLALVWRYRDRRWIAASALALLVLSKLFLWPVAVWLVATRRSRSALTAAVASVLAVAAASIPLGFDVLSRYASLLRTVSGLEGPMSASLYGLGGAVTGSTTAGAVLSLVLGGFLMAGVALLGRRDEDERAFRFAVVAALALTPIVWNHYLLLLYVPLALTRPRFSPIWLATAWVTGAITGGRLGGLQLVVALGALWAAVLIQGGVLRGGGFGYHGDAGRRRGLLHLVGTFALWASLAWVLVALVDVVPAVAALRSAKFTGGPSGTATVRLLRSGRTICVGLLTEGVQLPAVVQVVENGTGRVLLERTMGDRRFDACASYARSGERRNLAEEFSERRVRLSLRIAQRSGRAVLDGAIVRIQDVERGGG
jgi:hypothetical protein